MTDLVEQKKALRKYIKEQFSSVKDTKEQLSEKSCKICIKIYSTNVYKSAQKILLYMALWDEVELSGVISAAITDGKQVFIPKIVIDDCGKMSNELEFYEYKNSTSTHSGSYGIDEPDDKGTCFELKHYDEKILILVPGRAFSKSGQRLGRGKGFYDNFLNQIKELNKDNVTLAGVCFDFQIADSIPVEPHDVLMDCVFY